MPGASASSRGLPFARPASPPVVPRLARDAAVQDLRPARLARAALPAPVGVLVRQHLAHRRGVPVPARSRRRHALGVQHGGDVAQAHRLAAQQEDPPHQRRAGGVDHQRATLGLAHVAQRHVAALLAVFPAPGVAPVGRALHNVVSVELRQRREHRQHELAGRRGRVQALAAADNLHARIGHPLDQVEDNARVSAQAIQGREDHDVQLAGPDVGHQAGQLGPLGLALRAADAGVLVDAEHIAALHHRHRFALLELHVQPHAALGLVVGRDAQVDADP